MLLFLMLAVAVLMITMLGVARNYRRGIVRDREVEMIHRGEQYARAVKRYYHKFGNYPASIEALENTNKIRFLRKRYKDPMSPDGAWKLVHLTDVTLKAGGGLMPTNAAEGVGSSQTNSSPPNAGSASGSTANGAPQSMDGSTAGSTISGTASGTNNSVQDTGGTTGGTTGGVTSTATGTTGPAGSSSNGSNPILGGGSVLGVVSKQKIVGIHSFGDKTKYNEWLFIYDPSQDMGQMLVGPYNPKMFLGANSVGSANSTQTPSGTGTGTGNSNMGSTNTPSTPTR
jgi:hypothetical protein